MNRAGPCAIATFAVLLATGLVLGTSETPRANGAYPGRNGKLVAWPAPSMRRKGVSAEMRPPATASPKARFPTAAAMDAGEMTVGASA